MKISEAAEKLRVMAKGRRATVGTQIFVNSGCEELICSLYINGRFNIGIAEGHPTFEDAFEDMEQRLLEDPLPEPITDKDIPY